MGKYAAMPSSIFWCGMAGELLTTGGLFFRID